MYLSKNQYFSAKSQKEIMTSSFLEKYFHIILKKCSCIFKKATFHASMIRIIIHFVAHKTSKKSSNTEKYMSLRAIYAIWFFHTIFVVWTLYDFLFMFTRYDLCRTTLNNAMNSLSNNWSRSWNKHLIG